ncbi:transglycosylase SLT domain-containing protein [Nonomuraea sp. FMUSA5-5]|uniref:Transglycosylase SLT domain-containing protein n=1 Tax=Nonomuraea composti TaxID=2720023 RepID=A0ABX1BDD0_9ACTN|nr:transglycosylase SLT domain-containing protein [Nonomuraea sp. FMUSA5-5]NJP95799.1 transglycosylase SLT domain-containing protein [Nonomuraea sp. FMUSA5-5]
MSAIDEVRAAPGGGELADLAAKLVGDPGAIGAAAGAWRAAAGTGERHTGALSAAAAEVDGAWEGAGADAFAGYLGKVTGCGDRLRQALTECADHLDAAARTLRDAEAAAQDICRQYATAAQELRATTQAPATRATGGPTSSGQASSGPAQAAQASSGQVQAVPLTEEQIAQALRPMLDEARTALQRLVTDTGATLSGTAGKIQTALAAVPNVAAELPEPDTQPFTPAPGRPIGWSPARLEGQETALAAAPHGSGGGGFGGYGPSGPPPPGGGPAPQGQVADWINQAIAILKANGVPADKMNPNDIWLIIKHESGGNPHAINNWDSNAAKGTPSKGLMQTIDPTFNSYKLPGHGDIYNPVDNIIAGVRYSIARYGSVSNVPGVVGMKTGGGYRGY